MANDVVGIDIVARLDGFRSELAKIPDIGGKEAKALVGQLSREIKAAEKASRGAAAAARSHKVEVQGLSGAILKANLGMEAFKKVVDIGARAIGALVDRASEIDGTAKASIDALHASTQSLTDSLAIALVPAIVEVTQGLSDLADGARLAVDWLTGMDEVNRRSLDGQERARAAIDRQSEAVAELKRQLAVSADLDLLTSASGATSAETQRLTAEIEREIGVLRRLKGELGGMAGIGPRPKAAAPAAGPSAPPKGGGAKVVTEDIAGAIGELRSLTDAVAEASESATQRVINDAARQVEAISEALARIEGLATASASTKAAAQEAAAEAEIAIIMARDEALLAMEAERQAEMARLDDEATQRAIDNAQALAAERERTAGLYVAVAGATFGAIESVIDAYTDAAIASTAAESAARKEAMQDAWAASTALAIAQAAINIPLAISNALTSGSQINPVFGAAMAVAAGITAGASLAAVIAKAAAGPQFHAGGMVTRTADEVPATLLAGESVLNRDATRRLGEDGVRGLNRGENGGGPIVVVQQFRHRVLDAAVSDSLSRRRGPLYDAVAASRPKAGMHSPWS